jgi:hypothetical protein
MPCSTSRFGSSGAQVAKELQASSVGGTISNAYDTLDRLRSQTTAPGKVSARSHRAASAASLATYPVGRVPLEIHDRQDPNVVWLDLVEECVGKSAEDATTNSTMENEPGFRMLLN